MNSQDHREESIFDAALQLAAPKAREAFLREACGDDVRLRQNIEALLRAHAEAGAFLNVPAAGEAPLLASDAAKAVPNAGSTTVITVTEKPGDKIGRYKLLQVIGEGGCGVVYMAEQEEPVRRRVAFKIIKLGMDTRQVIARFEVERQALAMMDHPNIAKVLDAGATDAGRPFFVMELVRGVRITEYCDQNQLTTEERLRLFILVCRAIQHAHQKGVIHRDIKPSNILVTLHDGVPVPKVIDFGIAKATEQRLTDKTLFTEFQAFIGTPAYVSPEQAEMSGLDIDTRSDIYSLGVLLYELLTGLTPFDGVQLIRSGLDAMRRTIRESEPPKPSTRLSTMLDAELTTTAQRQQAEPPKLISRMQGDLDWIVMKCLEKDRTRRYETASSLAQDVERYLNNELVVARPPSKIYKFQKFVRRNKTAFIGGAAATTALIVGLIASTWLYFREREARKDAVAAEKEQIRLLGETEQARSNESQQRRQAESERRLALRTAYNSDMNLIQQAMAANNFGRTVDLLNRHRPSQTVESTNELRVERSAAAQLEPARPLTRPSGTLSFTGGKGRGEGEPRLIKNRSELRTEKATPNPADASLTSQLFPLSTDLRQWEWRYFWNQYRSDAAFALPRQSNSITTVAISPDGRFLVSNGTPGALKLWDLFRRAEVATFRVGGFGPGFGTGAFAFSPKGDRFAAFNDDRRRTTIKVWALPAREVLAEIPLEGGVQALAFNADGTKLLAVGQEFGQDLILRRWDFAKQEWLAPTPVKLSGEGIRPRGWIFSPDARRLAISDEAGSIRIIDSATGLETQSVAAFEEGMVHSLAFSPDGEWLAATAFMTETSIKLFKVETGAQVFKLTGHASWVPGVAFSADGKRMISASGDQTVRLWDLEQRRELAALRGHLSEVNCVAMTPDGRTIVSGCKDGSLFGWDAERVEPRKAFETLPVPVAGVEFLPDGQSLLSVNQDGAVSLWDATTLQERERISAFGGRVARLLVAPDGARIYASMPQGEIKVLDWKTRLILTNLSAPSGSGFPNRSSPPGRGFSNRPGRGFSSGLVGLVNQGRTLVTTGAGSTIRLWETESWQLKDLPKGGEGSSFPRFQMAPVILSPDGRFVIAAGRDGGIDFRNLLTGQTDKTLPAQNRWVSGLAFSPDGDLLAMSSVEGTINLLDASNGAVVDVLRGHLLGVHAVAFSPDGQRIASGSHGTEAVKLWDVVTRQEVGTLAGQGSMFGSVKFSPGGKLLVAVNGQGLAHVWRAPSLTEIETAEKTPATGTP